MHLVTFEGKPSPGVAGHASSFAGRRIHFIGIGGCGMSGLASVLLDAGAIISGSEPKPNEQTLALIQRGAAISRDQMGELLSAELDLVVRTAAVPALKGMTHPTSAAKRGVDCFR